MRISFSLVILCLLLAACSETKEFEDPIIIEEPEVTEEVIVDPVDNKEEPAEEAGDARTKLESYLAKDITYKASYQVNSEVNGESMSGVETLVVKGKDSIRKFEDESLYIIDDKVYLCNKDSCFDIPQEQPPADPDLTIPESIEVEQLESRTIADENVECFKLYEEGEITDCRAKTGLLAYYSRTTEGYSTELELLEFSYDVTETDFELPHEPQPFDPSQFE